jgi:hypothetical protein
MKKKREEKRQKRKEKKEKRKKEKEKKKYFFTMVESIQMCELVAR